VAARKPSEARASPPARFFAISTMLGRSMNRKSLELIESPSVSQGLNRPKVKVSGLMPEKLRLAS
jgi:hypothetical protein